MLSSVLLLGPKGRGKTRFGRCICGAKARILNDHLRGYLFNRKQRIPGEETTLHQYAEEIITGLDPIWVDDQLDVPFGNPGMQVDYMRMIKGRLDPRDESNYSYFTVICSNKTMDGHVKNNELVSSRMEILSKVVDAS